MYPFPVTSSDRRVSRNSRKALIMTTIQAPAVTTRSLLTSAVVAAPLWTVIALAQAATRDGFDLTRHPLSALSTGSLGWLQITNFVLAGILTIIGASGLRRALPGTTWAPRLVRISGIGMVASGALVMDPVGTPGA